MPLCVRIIPRLDIRNGRMIHPIRGEGVRDIGDPAYFAEKYTDEGADEILINDNVASLYGRDPDYSAIELITRNVFVPVLVAGGIREESHIRGCLNAGADRVAVNTGAKDVESALVIRYGASTLARQMDVRNGGRYESMGTGNRDLLGPAEEIARAGSAGEIVVTAIDRQGIGKNKGPDIELAREASSWRDVPVTYCGGVWSPANVVDIVLSGCSGIAIACALHKEAVTIDAIKRALKDRGIPVRMT